jgi:SRSO17 transposase
MLGKRANCQTLISLTLARNEVPIVVGLRLFLRESWTSVPLCMTRAGVPEPFRRPRGKPEIALEEIDRLIAAGVRFGAVLADAGYGLSAPFRQGLSARGLAWAVGVPKHQKVYPAGVSLIFPAAGRGRPRKNQIPDQLSVATETMLATATWRKVSWRRGVKGPLSARLAALRVRVADGKPQRILNKGQQHMPGEEAWHGVETSRHLQSVPRFGPTAASAIVTTVGDPKQFKCGRQFAVRLGLVRQQRLIGGKEGLMQVQIMSFRPDTSAGTRTHGIPV